MAISNEFTEMSTEDLRLKKPKLQRLTLVIGGIFAVMAIVAIVSLATGSPTAGVLLLVLAATMLPMFFAQIGAGRRLATELAKR